MKKYTNIIIIALVLISVSTYFIISNFNKILVFVGYYDDEITVMNTADVHGHIMYDSDVGGYYSLKDVSVIMGLPVIKHFSDEIRAKNKNVLFLDSGDMFHGTNEANIEKGKGVVEVANMMGYNGMVPGNHDFNFGFDRLLEIKSQLNFPILSANIYKDGELAFEEYKIMQAGNKKVGVFGLTTPWALSFTNSRDNDGVTIEDPVECAKRVIEKLRPQVDAIILVSHLGEDVDENLVKKVDGIDLILCGHYHFVYESPKKVKNTYLVEAGAWTTHLGTAKLYFKNNKLDTVIWDTITTKDKSKADKSADAVAQKYFKAALESSKEVVGRSDTELNGIRFQLRSEETNLGNLLADAMRESANAEIALMNGGGIRESIPAGEINLYRIGKTLPFSNSLVTVRMKGEKIYSAIERGVRDYTSGTNGGFLQVSGINCTIDGSKLAGERVKSITIGGQPLDKNKYYTVATNDYLYNGGDNYEEFKGAELINMSSLLKDVLAQYIKSKRVVSPREEGRIKIINPK